MSPNLLLTPCVDFNLIELGVHGNIGNIKSRFQKRPIRMRLDILQLTQLANVQLWAIYSHPYWVLSGTT